MLKFIHAADIHIDSPLIGLENYESAPVEEIRGATRKALNNLINLAIEEKVSFVIISGDMYDGDWKDYNTGLFLLSRLSKLTSKGISVFIVKGNHDAESKISRELKLPNGINMFSSKKPETFILKELNTAIHGQSFATRAVTEDLASSYPMPVPGMLNIGVLHTSVNGREGHENYAPCSLSTLKSKNYDYWALGHIHKREILSEKPWIVFSGNTQGRHIRETGAKGCMLVTADTEAHSVVSVEFKALHALVWSFITIDISGISETTEVVEAVSLNIEKEFIKNNKVFTVLRIILKGSCKAHRQLSLEPERWINEIRLSIADSSFGDSVWLEKLLIKTTFESDIEEIKKRNDPIGNMLKYIESLKSGENKENKKMIYGIISKYASDLNSKLPPELTLKLYSKVLSGSLIDSGSDSESDSESDSDSESEKFQEIITEAKEILISHLLSQSTKDTTQ